MIHASAVMLSIASASVLGLVAGVAPALAQAPAQSPQQQQPQAAPPQFVFSPWAKFCNKGPELNARMVCFTGRDARTDAGVPAVAAVLVEPEGEAKKILRVTLVGPLLLAYGARILLDQNQPQQSPFYTCFGASCVADYEGTPDMIDKLKKGQALLVQGISLNGQQVGVSLPLAGFAKANEGPASDPKEYEEQHKKLQEELQKKQPRNPAPPQH